MQSSFCGIQVLTSQTTIASQGRPFAQQYRFRLKNLQGQSYFDQTILQTVNTFNLNNFLNLPAGKTFECYVQWNNGGDWKPWGTMCYITSPQLTLTQSTMPKQPTKNKEN